jgi:NAD(P)-dependent dehydrogenase (short-subunit alcohol dehydrogenase family)
MSTRTDGDLFAGRVAVVTGGARGLGYAMATALAKHGAHVALLDLSDGVEAAARALAESTGSATFGTTVNVADEGSVQQAIDSVDRELGTPTILVNSAGVALHAPAIETTAERWRALMDVNVTGTFFASQAFARKVVAAAKTGTIVNVSSMSGSIVNIPQAQAAYNTSKAAVIMLTRSLAVEWLPLGIRVNAIAPGYFASDMTRDFVTQNPEMAAEWISRVPAGRMGEPDELGDLVVYLASDRSRYVVGQNILIDGGYTLV